MLHKPENEADNETFDPIVSVYLGVLFKQLRTIQDAVYQTSEDFAQLTADSFVRSVKPVQCNVHQSRVMLNDTYNVDCDADDATPCQLYDIQPEGNASLDKKTVFQYREKCYVNQSPKNSKACPVFKPFFPLPASEAIIQVFCPKCFYHVRTRSNETCLVQAVLKPNNVRAFQKIDDIADTMQKLPIKSRACNLNALQKLPSENVFIEVHDVICFRGPCILRNFLRARESDSKCIPGYVREVVQHKKSECSKFFTHKNNYGRDLNRNETLSVFDLEGILMPAYCKDPSNRMLLTVDENGMLIYDKAFFLGSHWRQVDEIPEGYEKFDNPVLEAKMQNKDVTFTWEAWDDLNLTVRWNHYVKKGTKVYVMYHHKPPEYVVVKDDRYVAFKTFHNVQVAPEFVNDTQNDGLNAFIRCKLGYGRIISSVSLEAYDEQDTLKASTKDDSMPTASTFYDMALNPDHTPTPNTDAVQFDRLHELDALLTLQRHFQECGVQYNEYKQYKVLSNKLFFTNGKIGSTPHGFVVDGDRICGTVTVMCLMHPAEPFHQLDIRTKVQAFMHLIVARKLQESVNVRPAEKCFFVSWTQSSARIFEFAYDTVSSQLEKWEYILEQHIYKRTRYSQWSDIDKHTNALRIDTVRAVERTRHVCEAEIPRLRGKRLQVVDDKWKQQYTLWKKHRVRRNLTLGKTWLEVSSHSVAIHDDLLIEQQGIPPQAQVGTTFTLDAPHDVKNVTVTDIVESGERYFQPLYTEPIYAMDVVVDNKGQQLVPIVNVDMELMSHHVRVTDEHGTSIELRRIHWKDVATKLRLNDNATDVYLMFKKVPVLRTRMKDNRLVCDDLTTASVVVVSKPIFLDAFEWNNWKKNSRMSTTEQFVHITLHDTVYTALKLQSDGDVTDFAFDAGDNDDPDAWDTHRVLEVGDVKFRNCILHSDYDDYSFVHNLNVRDALHIHTTVNPVYDERFWQTLFYLTSFLQEDVLDVTIQKSVWDQHSSASAFLQAFKKMKHKDRFRNMTFAPKDDMTRTEQMHCILQVLALASHTSLIFKSSYINNALRKAGLQ